jgi:hypothetical protein
MHASPTPLQTDSTLVAYSAYPDPVLLTSFAYSVLYNDVGSVFPAILASALPLTLVHFVCVPRVVSCCCVSLTCLCVCVCVCVAMRVLYTW